MSIIPSTTPPSWATIIGTVGVMVNTLALLAGLTMFLIHGGFQSTQNALDVVTINARLDRIFEKLDVLPVMNEQIQEAQRQITAGKGDWATMDGRLRAMEQNTASNRSDLEKLGRSIR